MSGKNKNLPKKRKESSPSPKTPIKKTKKYSKHTQIKKKMLLGNMADFIVKTNKYSYACDYCHDLSKISYYEIDSEGETEEYSDTSSSESEANDDEMASKNGYWAENLYKHILSYTRHNLEIELRSDSD